MANDYVQLPYTATTSGDILDASLVTVGANAVKRERMVIVDDTKTANFAALVTTSGALSVQIQTSGVIVELSSNPVAGQVVSLSSGLITLSSNPVAGQVVSLSSGLVTLSSNPVTAQIVSLSSGTVTLSSAIGISSGIVALSSGTVTLSSAIGISSGVIGLSSGTVTLSSDPTVVSASSGVVQVLTTGTYLVNATSTSGLLVDVSRGVTLAFFNFTATSSGLKSLVAASGSNKVKLVSYVLVSNSTQEVSFYSSNTPIAGSSSVPMVLSSYSGISAVGDRTSWLMETSAAGSLQVHLGNAGIVAGHGSYIYEV